MLMKTLWLILAVSAVADDPLVVETTYGKVRGSTATSRSGRQYLEFISIPYAKPPVGDLRFKPPEEPEPWTSVLDATAEGPFCIQVNMYEMNPEVVGKEDCLHLSVYTYDTRGRAPVLFHIHGGGYLAGDKSFTGPQYMMDEDVVIVDINYRLGIMGFLSFEDALLPGNAGLKDQNMALRWVIKNIARFGGDPGRVTLVGESAGSGSVTHHTISALSKGLFQGGIAESGTIYNMLSLLPPGLAKSRAQKLASMLSCPQELSLEAMVCLQQQDARELVARILEFRQWQVDPLLLFQPVLEPSLPGAFMTGPISSWEPSPVPLLMGTNSAEGLIRTSFFVNYEVDYKWLNENFNTVAPLTFRYFSSSSTPAEVTKQIKKFYFNDNEITGDSWFNITNAYTDAWFTNGIFRGADKHTGDVYFYYFDYVGEYTFGPQNKTLLFGASHLDEITYLWEIEKFSPLKGEDLDLSKKMVKIWTDFATTGKATSTDINEQWKTWTPDNHNYLHINKDAFKMKEGLHDERYKFWNSLNYRDRLQ